MTVTLLSSVDVMTFAAGMAVTTRPMTMPVLVEKEQPKYVRQKSEAPDYKDQFWVRDDLGFDKALYGLKEDRQTQCNQEYSID